MQGVRFLCMCLFGVLARVRGEFPARSAGDAGMVPLTSRETAKGRKSTTQLAALRQVSPILQRSHPRAKRKPAPRIMHSCPEAHRWDVAEIALARGASLRDAADVCSRGAHR